MEPYKIIRKGSRSEITLRSGDIAIIDSKNEWILKEWRWWRMNGRYVYISRPLPKPRISKTGKIVHMETTKLHQIVLPLKPGLVIDHIDNEPKNNLESNLRLVTHAQNILNHFKRKNCSSGALGVTSIKRNKTRPWRAYIKLPGGQFHIGYFSTEVDAAAAYDGVVRFMGCKYRKTNASTGFLKP